jgi:UDP-glucose 4-epimerase
MNNKYYILIVDGVGYIGPHTNIELKKQGYKAIVLNDKINIEKTRAVSN